MKSSGRAATAVSRCQSRLDGDGLPRRKRTDEREKKNNPAADKDPSGLILSDDVFARLLTFPNVIINGHQAFFTREALLNIAARTIDNITKFENNQPLEKLAG